MRRPNFRGSVAGFFFLCLAVFDFLCSSIALIRYMLRGMISFDIRKINTFMCVGHLFLTYWSSYCAVWMLVLISLERWTGIHFPHKVKLIFTRCRALLCVIILSVVAGTLCSQLLFTFEFNTYRRLCTNRRYARYFILKIWPWIDFAIYNLIPFAIVLVCNVSIIITLIRAAHYRKKSMHTNNQGPRMTSMTAILIAVSISFFCLASPYNSVFVYHTWIINTGKAIHNHRLAQISLAYSVTLNLLMCNHVINFYLYCLTGRKFREELKTMFCKKQH